jgi:hypothetical protein
VGTIRNRHLRAVHFAQSGSIMDNRAAPSHHASCPVGPVRNRYVSGSESRTVSAPCLMVLHAQGELSVASADVRTIGSRQLQFADEQRHVFQFGRGTPLCFQNRLAVLRGQWVRLGMGN